jgi:hypothetical protein
VFCFMKYSVKTELLQLYYAFCLCSSSYNSHNSCVYDCSQPIKSNFP